MVQEKSSISVLVLSILIASQALAQDAVEQERQKALSSLKSGTLIRVYCDDLGAIGGVFVENHNDTLRLGVDKRTKAGGKPSRRVMRRGRASYDRAPKWKPIDQDTSIAFSSIREIQVRGRGTMTGAIVGGVILGGGGLVLGAISTAIDSEGSGSSDLVKLAVGGVVLGGLFGAAVGAMIPDWKLRYREPGFQAGLSLRPLLAVNTASRSLDSTTLYLGVNLSW